MSPGTLHAWLRENKRTNPGDPEWVQTEQQMRSPKRVKPCGNQPEPKVRSRYFKASTSSQIDGNAPVPSNSDPTETIDKPLNTDSPEMTSTKLRIVEESGDIFSAPSNSLLVHACNCSGSWGAGIAKAFKLTYPHAFKAYAALCKRCGPTLRSGAALIAPFDDSDDMAVIDPSKHFVGCLFTSQNYGPRKDSPAMILAATAPAMRDLLKQATEWNHDVVGDGFGKAQGRVREDEKIREVQMCKINSGLFNVPWTKTKAVLEDIDVSEFDVKTIKLVSPPD